VLVLQSELTDKMLIMAAVNGSRMSLYDSLRQSSSAATLIESLQSELKQREGEVLQLQVTRHSVCGLCHVCVYNCCHYLFR